jgi:nitroreductase
MADQISLFDAIYSQRQITRYKTDPVPQGALEHMVDAAVRAPNGGNTQPWEFVVVNDPAKVRQLGELYKNTWLDAMGWEPSPDESRVYRHARYLAHHMPEVPAMIVVCADHARGSGYESGQPIERGRHAASIWPAIQNLFLAGRALGLGTRITTVLNRKEDEVRDILGLPEHAEMICLTPVGYPRGSFGPTNRRPASEVTSINGWGNRTWPN